MTGERMGERAAIAPNDGKPLRLVRAFIRRTVLDRANLAQADLSGADMTMASARFADFDGATMQGTILHGTDLTGARNLTVDQLAKAIIDGSTILPDYIDRVEVERLSSATQGRGS